MPSVGVRKDQEIAKFRADFQPRWDAAFAFRTACSMNQGLLGLRGFWPMSAFAETGNAYDQSGNNRTLTYNGNPVYANDGLMPYIALDGTGDWLARADEAGLSISGTETSVIAASRGLSIGGWFYFDNAAGSAEFLMGQWNAATNRRAYRLRRTVAGEIQFTVSTDGTATVSATSTLTPAATTWIFAAGRFDPSTELNVWIKDSEVVNAAGTPASIHDSNSDFRIGATGAGSNLLTGRASLCWLCGTLLPDSAINVLYWHTKAMLGLK